MQLHTLKRTQETSSFGEEQTFQLQVEHFRVDVERNRNQGVAAQINGVVDEILQMSLDFALVGGQTLRSSRCQVSHTTRAQVLKKHIFACVCSAVRVDCSSLSIVISSRHACLSPEISFWSHSERKVSNRNDTRQQTRAARRKRETHTHKTGDRRVETCAYFVGSTEKKSNASVSVVSARRQTQSARAQNVETSKRPTPRGSPFVWSQLLAQSDDLLDEIDHIGKTFCRVCCDNSTSRV